MNYILLLYVYEWFVCMCTTFVPGTHVAGSLGARAVDDCESSCEIWEPNPRPLQEQSVLLTSNLLSPRLRMKV